ncbi:hypothetical protein O9H85_08295 [Paenibacillus filicis]|uniref:CopG-like ribbon-helix-helix domain-containing protein n=1 Tax=Paenibacillus gyeongsangnamensis TaxID=3388067 RepID=A0ABT4Q6D1_9BACL|nr:hypothetical protein [Paenibacillus filicis]MCZ8512433.1 hypothetical protein [Paenibacillus filicis]
MAGRPKKDEKKIREAIYFDPDLLEWLKEKAEKKRSTVSVVVNGIVAEKKDEDKETASYD